METPKTEEKVVTAKSEGDKTEAPKKKKKYYPRFHAQNASDGGKKTRKKPVKAEGERTGFTQEMQKEEIPTVQEQTVTDALAAREDPQGDGQGRQAKTTGRWKRQGGRFGGQEDPRVMARTPGRQIPGRRKPPG